MRLHFLGPVIALSIAIASPASVQAQGQDAQAQNVEQRADRDDHGEWGWLGLLGLAGLMGLKRRDRHEDVRHGHTAAR
jgi:hypothetical protein